MKFELKIYTVQVSYLGDLITCHYFSLKEVSLFFLIFKKKQRGKKKHIGKTLTYQQMYNPMTDNVIPPYFLDRYINVGPKTFLKCFTTFDFVLDRGKRLIK